MNALELDSFIPTCEALSIIYGVQESDTASFKAFVNAGYLMESGASPDIVMEGVLDIFKTIADGIKKFIEKVKDFFKRILLYITSATEDLDKVAEQVKNHIKDRDIDFTIDGYKFTVLGKDGPSMTEFQKIVSEYNSDMDDISKLKEAEIKKKVLDWMSESHLDKLRGEVLGTGNSILEDDFLDTIREYYRGGASSTDTITVTKSMVTDIINHSKRLEDTKKSAIKDRDNLVNLLSKTATFFDKTLPTMYKGNNFQMNTAKVDVSDNKFSKTDNYHNVPESATKLISTYASFKSRQVNKIASMINLVACERVNALRDQIKQERTILRKCLFEDKSGDKVEESFQVFPDTGYMGRDYVTYAMESALSEYRQYDAIYRRTILNEAVFLSESLKTGNVYYLMEADMDSTAGKIKNTIGQIIETVVATFRKKAMGEAERYKPWITEIKDGLVEKAKAKKEFKMANFADADYAQMANTIVSSIKKAYASKNYEDTAFARDIISTFTSFDKINDDTSRTIMLNYFRTGKAEEKLDTVTINGSGLANRLPAMIKYLDQYGSVVTKPSENISSTFKTQSEAFKVTESMTGNTYLELIGRPVCESDVVSCVDYNSMFGPVAESVGTWVTEADGDAGAVKIGRGNAGVSDANKSMGEQAKASGSEGSAEAKDIKSATNVSSTEDKTADTTGEKKTNAAATTYKRNVDRFFKNCITLYIKAREEQFLAYVNALADIDGARPKFDKNGKYIPKEKVKAEETEAVKTESK